MANTKIDIINDAYDQMRISGLTVNPTPEDTTIALTRLESMMAQFEARSICVDYNFELDPDPNDLTGLELQHQFMASSNLTLRLAASFGKAVPQELQLMASQSLSTSSSIVAADKVRMVQAPNRQPIGSGNTLRYNKYQRFYREGPLPPADCATNVMTIDDIDDFTESFDAYLKIDEAIESFTMTVDEGLTLQSSSNDTPLISYRIKADSNVTSGRWQQVKIVITTDTGRVDTRFVNFDVQTNETISSQETIFDEEIII